MSREQVHSASYAAARFDDSVYCKIANMGFVCACLIVSIHVTPVLTGFWINDFFVMWVKRLLSNVAVPVFFMISGFLLARRTEEAGWYKHALSSRLRSIVVPYFVLSAMWTPQIMAFHYIGCKFFGADGSSRACDPTELSNVLRLLGLLPVGGSSIVGFWYMKALFYIILISPFLAFVIRRGKAASVALILIFFSLWCWQSGLMLPESLFSASMAYELSFRGVLFFTIGMALFKYAPRRVPCWMPLLALPSACGMLWCLARAPALMRPELKTALQFGVIAVSAFALWTSIPSHKWTVSASSFPLFALHGMLLYLLPLPMKALGVYDGFLQRCGSLVLWVVTILSAILLAKFMKRFFPRFARIIFGGR